MNPEQLKICKATSGAVLVLGGAGSGKSKLIAHHIGHLLLDKKVLPEQLLVLTSSNRGARDMKTRLGKNLPYMGNLPNICAKILREQATALETGTPLLLVDYLERLQIIRTILQQLKLENLDPQTVDAEIVWAKRNGLDAVKYPNKSTLEQAKKIAQVYAQYEKTLQDKKRYDAEDMLKLCLDLFKKQPKVLKIYQDRFTHILVDEYNELPLVYGQWLDLISVKNKNIFATADPNAPADPLQSSGSKNIQQFIKDFKLAKVFTLEQNYRSNQNIMSMFNALLQKNKKPSEIKIWGNADKGDPVFHFHALDPADEARFIADEIETNRLENRSLKSHNNYAIVYRSPEQIQTISEVFVKRGVPLKRPGQDSFYFQEEVRDVMNYLKVLANPYDDQALVSILNKPERGIDGDAVEVLKEQAEAEALPLFEVIAKPKKISKEALDGLTQLKKQLDKISKLKESHLDDLIETILVETGYRKMLKLEKAEQDKLNVEKNKNKVEPINFTGKKLSKKESKKLASQNHKLDNLENLKTVARQKRVPLQDFIHHVALMSPLDLLSPLTDEVNLLHYSEIKGLEFGVIFITAFEQGLLPRPTETDKELEEERAWLYTAMSRARLRLYLSSVYKRKIGNEIQYNKISSFYKEMPYTRIANFVSESLDDTALASIKEEKIPFSVRGVLGNMNVAPPPPPQVLETYHIGDTVEHTVFGRGKVLKVEGSELDLLLDVKFPSQPDIKSLMARYSPIVKKEKKI